MTEKVLLMTAARARGLLGLMFNNGIERDEETGILIDALQRIACGRAVAVPAEWLEMERRFKERVLDALMAQGIGEPHHLDSPLTCLCDLERAWRNKALEDAAAICDGRCDADEAARSIRALVRPAPASDRNSPAAGSAATDQVIATDSWDCPHCEFTNLVTLVEGRCSHCGASR